MPITCTAHRTSYEIHEIVPSLVVYYERLNWVRKTLASSAAVESQMENIKKDLLNKNKASPMRLDDYVHALLAYIVGRSNIFEAEAIEIDFREEINDNSTTVYNGIHTENLAQSHANEVFNSTSISSSNAECSLNTDTDENSTACNIIYMQDHKALKSIS